MEAPDALISAAAEALIGDCAISGSRSSETVMDVSRTANTYAINSALRVFGGVCVARRGKRRDGDGGMDGKGTE